MNLVLASHNKNKIREMKQIMEDASIDVTVVSADDVGVLDIEENGNSFEENSLLKAKSVIGNDRWAIADDSGLSVDALNGEPGIYSARYSGGNDEDNINKLLFNLKDIPKEKRDAKFVCCVTIISPEGEVFSIRGECSGKIIDEKRGDNGFGYDPVFLIPSLDKTFAQLSGEEKNKISHRGIAMRKACEILKERIKQKE